MHNAEQEPPIAITSDVIRPPKKVTIGGQAIRTNDMAVYPTDNKPVDVQSMLELVRAAEKAFVSRQRPRNRPGARRGSMSNFKHS